MFQMKARSYKKVKSGIAFDHWQITPQLVRNAKVELDKLARNKIGSYGLLNVLRNPRELRDVVHAMRPVIEATHWPLVRANETYADGKMLRGLSFELGTLVYVLKEGVKSLRAGAYARCTDFGMTSRDAICGTKHYVDSKKQFLGDPYDLYATFLKDDVLDYIAFAEYHTSAQEKFVAARRRYGRLHHRSVWLLFNVHLGDVNSTCGADAFGIVKWFCKYYRTTRSCGP
ncbi:hypothetical protein MRX96_001490 [Rhipicephalus microplus]